MTQDISNQLDAATGQFRDGIEALEVLSLKKLSAIGLKSDVVIELSQASYSKTEIYQISKICFSHGTIALYGKKFRGDKRFGTHSHYISTWNREIRVIKNPCV